MLGGFLGLWFKYSVKKGTHLGKEAGGVVNFFLLTVEAMGSAGRAC